MEQSHCCAVFGPSPMSFPWGFDEEADGCRRLKLELLQKIMELCQMGVTQFAVVCDFGVGLYAGEMINSLREQGADLQLFCVTPHEEQASKWAPYLRERYFTMLEKCTYMTAASLQKIPRCAELAHKQILDMSGHYLAVRSQNSKPDVVTDAAIAYARRKKLPGLILDPNGLEWSNALVHI